MSAPTVTVTRSIMIILIHPYIHTYIVSISEKAVLDKNKIKRGGRETTTQTDKEIMNYQKRLYC